MINISDRFLFLIFKFLVLNKYAVCHRMLTAHGDSKRINIPVGK